MYESLKVAPTLYYVLNFTHTDVKTETEHIFYIESYVVQYVRLHMYVPDRINIRIPRVMSIL